MTLRKWALIVGDRRTGKTSLARAVAETLTSRGLRVAGVLQDAIEGEGDGERVAYEAVRLTHPAERVVVARRGATEFAGGAICSYAFDDEAFATVAAWLERDGAHADVIVVDEVSKAEARGRGHGAAIAAALTREPLVVLVTRRDELENVVARFALGPPVARLDTLDGAGPLPTFVDEVARATGR